MANYHTAPDCGCSQNPPRQSVPEKPCPASMSGRQAMPASCPEPMQRRQMMQRPCPASMNGRPMIQRPCPADMPARPGMSKPCPADMPMNPMADCPSMPEHCPHKADPLADMPIAMAYVPWQFFHETFEPDKALQCGTIFPELSKPFYGKGGCPK